MCRVSVKKQEVLLSIMFITSALTKPLYLQGDGLHKCKTSKLNRFRATQICICGGSNIKGYKKSVSFSKNERFEELQTLNWKNYKFLLIVENLKYLKRIYTFTYSAL